MMPIPAEVRHLESEEFLEETRFFASIGEIERYHRLPRVAVRFADCVEGERETWAIAAAQASAAAWLGLRAEARLWARIARHFWAQGACRARGGHHGME